MFILKVKHLLLACCVTGLFLYFTSNPKINDIPTEVQTGEEIRKYKSTQKEIEKSDDFMEKFIDSYIKDDFVIKISNETTEEYISYPDDNEEEKDYSDGKQYNLPNETITDYSYNNSRNETGIKLDVLPHLGSDSTSSYPPPLINNSSSSVFHEVITSVKRNSSSRPPKALSTFRTNSSSYPPIALASFGGRPNHSSSSPIPPLIPPLAPLINEERKSQIHKVSPIVVLPRDTYWPPVLQPSDAAILSQINYTKYSSEDRAYLSGRVGIYEERARTVGEVCRSHPELIAPTPINNFVWDQNHQPNIVWCEIPKAASTSWMVNFLRLGHYRENDTTLMDLPKEERDAIRFETRLKDDNLHFRVLRLFPAPNTTKERYQVFSKALRFIIVRHPFTRLLSAYLDKMTTLNPLPIIYKFRQLQTAIIERYRGNKILPSNHDPTFPTFEEFVQYVIDSTADLKTLKDWKKVICWQPYWTKCGVCAHDYQMIMKTETMEEDERFLVKLVSLKELDKVYEWRHSKKSHTEKEEYFKQLSKRQVHLLHQRYFLDFQMFGYSIHQYLELAFDAKGQND